MRDENKINSLNSIIIKKHSILSFSLELFGIFLLIYAFFVPWVYHLFLDINYGVFIRYFKLSEVIVSGYFYISLVCYPILIEIIIIILRINLSSKLRTFTSLALIELLILIPGISLPFNISLGRCYSFIPEKFCLRSGYSYGPYLYIIGMSILVINELQIILYSKLVRMGQNNFKVKIIKMLKRKVNK